MNKLPLLFCRADIRRLSYSEGSDVIYAVGLHGVSQFEAYQINVKTGEMLKQSSKSFPSGFSGDLLLLADDTAAAMDSSGTTFVVIGFQDGEIGLHPTRVPELVQDSSGAAVIYPSEIPGMCVLKLGRSIILIKVTNDGKVEVMDKLDHGTAVSDSLPFSEGQEAFAVVQHAAGKIILTVKQNNDWSSNLLEDTIQMDNQRGLVHQVFLNTYIRTDRSNGFRVLIVMEDDSLLLLQQGAIVWSREDGLASIIDVTASELPVEKDGVSVAKVEHGLLEWLEVGYLIYLYESCIHGIRHIS